MAILRRKNRQGKLTGYQVLVDRTDPVNGSRKRVTVGTYRTRKEAEKAERDALNHRDKGTFVDPSQVTIAELLADWHATKATTVTPNTATDYKTAIQKHIAPALGRVKVQRLTPAAVQKQYAAWQEAGMSARMVQRCHIVLSQALSQAVRFGLLARNVCTEVDTPATEKKRGSVWTPEETRTFLDTAMHRPILTRAGDTGKTRPDELSPLWHFLALEGMRRGEALGLRWQDVSWDARTNDLGKPVTIIHISQTVIPDKGNKGAAVIRPRTKTSAGARSVALSQETVSVLREHRDRQAFARKAAGDAWNDHDLIVCTSTGTPINPNNVTRSFQRLYMLANLSPIRLHDLRHGAATMLLRAGVPAKIVSERLGHATVAITLDLYSHVTGDMQDAAASAMDAIMGTGERTEAGTA